MDGTGELPTGAIVVLLDAFNPTFPTSEERKAAAEKLLRKLDSESPIAVYVADPELHIIRDFIGDNGRSQRFTRQVSRDEMKTALKAFEAKPTNGHLVHELHITDIQNFQLATLESIATHVADLPGKKALIWFCQASGFAIERMQPSSSLYIPMVLMLRALQASDMSIYSIDCFGRHLPPRWTPPEFGAVDMTRILPSAPKFKRPQKPYMDQFAEFTGGRAYYGMQQLETAIADASADLKHSYRLKWQPGTDRREQLLHFVRLTSSEPDVQLRYLHSYVDGLATMSREDRLKAAERALDTPLAAREIIVDAHVRYAPQNTGPAVVVSFAPEHIRLRKTNGAYTGLLDVIYAFFDTTGKRISAGERSEVRLNITEDKRTAFLSDEQKIESALTVPAGATKLRVVVRDANSGALGSVTVSL